MDFRAGKKPSRAILEFESNLERNLFELQAELENGSYTHGGYTHKIISEKKRRDIYVVGVRDRVVHRLLYNYLVPIVEPRLDYDVWSCRAGKGLQACLERMQSLVIKHPQAWVWRTDIQKFFDSIDRPKLKILLHELVKDSQAQRLLNIVVDSHHGRAGSFGMPIGNLTSQVLANIYLNEFDRFVRTNIKPLAYIRYGDDMVAFFANMAEARHNAPVMRTQLRDRLGLSTRFEYIFQARHGVRVLGHNICASAITMSRPSFTRHCSKLDAHNLSSSLALNVSSGQRDALQGMTIVRWGENASNYIARTLHIHALEMITIPQPSNGNFTST